MVLMTEAPVDPAATMPPAPPTEAELEKAAALSSSQEKPDAEFDESTGAMDAGDDDDVSPFMQPSPMPIRTDEAFKWWASDAVESLRNAAAVGQEDGDVNEEEEEAMVALLTQRITRQVAKQIPGSVYERLSEDIRDGIQNVSDAVDRRQEKNLARHGAEMMEDTSKELERLICDRIPEEITRLLAKKIYERLVEEVHGAVTRQDLSALSTASTEEEKCEANENLEGATLMSISSTLSLESSLSGASTTSSSSGRVGYMSASEKHRKFYEDNNDPVMQLDAFKKFKLVLVSGRGLKVTKHNRHGGTSERVIRYNPEKNKIYWESSKMTVGAGVLRCDRIINISRETNVLYIWHLNDEGKKKLVGFETQREADARQFELAMMYMMRSVKATVTTPSPVR